METPVAGFYGDQMSSALSLSYLPSRRSRDLSGPGLVIAAAILALFVSDVAHAAGPARLTVVEGPTTAAALDVVVSVDADTAPSFQVFRGAVAGSWIVELPGVELNNAVIARRGADVLLAEAHVEPGIKGGTGRIVLQLRDDDVDFDAATRKKTLQITFHHQGDKNVLVAAHAARVVQQERIAKLALDTAAADVEVARRAEQDRLIREKLAAEQARLAALTKQQEQQREQERLAAGRAEAERARLIAVQKTDEDKARAVAQKKIDDDKAAAVAQKKIDDDKAAAVAQKKVDDDKARIAAQAQQQAAQKARLAVIAQKKIDDDKAAAVAAEKVRLAAIAQQKIDDDKAAAVARAAAEQKKRDSDAALAAEAQRREEQRVAAVAAQKKIDDDKLKVEAQRLAQSQLAALEKKKLDDDKARALAEQQREQERARLAEQARLKAADAENARLAAIEAETARQKKIDDAVARQQADDAEKVRLADARAQAQRHAADVARAAVDDDVGFGGKAVAAPTTRPLPTTISPRAVAAVSVKAAVNDDFGGLQGGRTVEFSRDGNHYQRVNLPNTKGDEWGGDDDDSNDIDEGEGRSVLSQVMVQRSAAGARVGVRVDGGARYHVSRRGRDHLVLTLVDTRAENLDVRRVLDARALGSAVLRVMPTVEEDSRFRIELVVETRGQAPVRIEQDGQMLWLEVIG